MRTSTQGQLALELTPPETEAAVFGASSTTVGSNAASRPRDPDQKSNTPFNFPDFRSQGETQLYAEVSRVAGRINAAAISKEELERLLSERQQLLDRYFEGNITRQQKRRLEYVRWSLDRIEDAQSGHILDVLEDGIAAYERFSNDVRSLKDQLGAHYGKRRR